MIQIRFDSGAEQRKALGWLPGRYSFKSWPDGTMVVPEEALPSLALEGMSFSVEGSARYEQIVPSVRNPASAPIQ
ncbi:MAG: hypothetical protein KJ057_03795 [Phycisphaerae bacterium]|nr:MAG: hypothetical protein EDS66_07050 [Planctomycetota bacterium]KAB2948641.1 MAG: hypothetical protein F9K17_05805 [Phycisphaerae bacterium]MBE7457774.1 hypothetical protein [Planctomycetia bacterium]MCK6463707.1 hypothetical protein [Phycisphaerae bacterium]MCL4717578.1 hypothetical protein [Phycisphaerae bacterium]